MRHKISLGIIILLGFMLRVYLVGNLPMILNRDEAALAYNAYLIKDSGQDEWQRSWPITFQSFGDYKLPGYIYTLVPFFLALGASDFVVRLPSVLAGTGLIAAAYFIARKMNFKKPLALLFSLLIALQPVFIFYSRMAWEANLALLLTVISWYLLFLAKKSDKKLKKTDLGGVVLVFLASLTYNSPLIYIPFFILALIVSRGIKKYQRWLVPVFGLVLVGVINALILLPVSAQKSGITIFTDETVWANYVVYRSSLPSWAAGLIGSKYIYWLQVVFKNIINSFSPQFLVTQGGSHPWHNLPGAGHLYWLVYGLALIGIGLSLYQIVKGLLNKLSSNSDLSQYSQQKLLVLYTLIFSLAPAVITVDAPHATRSLLFFFILTLLALIAFRFLINKFDQHHQKFLAGLALILSLEASVFLKKYFVDYPKNQKMFKPGFDILIQELDKRFPEREVAIVADGYQYILAAWYLKLDPQTYFETNIRQQPDKIGLRYGQQVDDYHFIADKEDRSSQEQILVFWDETNQQWEIERF